MCARGYSATCLRVNPAFADANLVSLPGVPRADDYEADVILSPTRSSPVGTPPNWREWVLVMPSRSSVPP
jgi:hypothetical protein